MCESMCMTAVPVCAIILSKLNGSHSLIQWSLQSISDLTVWFSSTHSFPKPSHAVHHLIRAQRNWMGFFKWCMLLNIFYDSELDKVIASNKLTVLKTTCPSVENQLPSRGWMKFTDVNRPVTKLIFSIFVMNIKTGDNSNPVFANLKQGSSDFHIKLS